jgi:hypothetical protein
MGQYAATNIVKLLLAAEEGQDPVDLAQLQPFTPRMALAIGTTAIAYPGGGPENIRTGPWVKQKAFGRGLAIDGLFEDHSYFRVEMLIPDRHAKELGTGSRSPSRSVSLRILSKSFSAVEFRNTPLSKGAYWTLCQH